MCTGSTKLGAAGPVAGAFSESEADEEASEGCGRGKGCANVDAARDGGSFDTSFDTRLLPAMVRGPSSNTLDRGDSEAIETAEEAGLSESRSRLWLGIGDACGRGRSPTDASS